MAPDCKQDAAIQGLDLLFEFIELSLLMLQLLSVLLLQGVVKAAGQQPRSN